MEAGNRLSMKSIFGKDAKITIHEGEDDLRWRHSSYFTVLVAPSILLAGNLVVLLLCLSNFLQPKKLTFIILILILIISFDWLSIKDLLHLRQMLSWSWCQGPPPPPRGWRGCPAWRTCPSPPPGSDSTRPPPDCSSGLSPRTSGPSPQAPQAWPRQPWLCFCQIWKMKFFKYLSSSPWICSLSTSCCLTCSPWPTLHES